MTARAKDNQRERDLRWLASTLGSVRAARLYVRLAWEAGVNHDSAADAVAAWCVASCDQLAYRAERPPKMRAAWHVDDRKRDIKRAQELQRWSVKTLPLP